MKIAVLASEVMKEEMLQKSVSAEIKIVWVNSMEELITTTDAEAYFDFDFINDEERVEQLKKLLPKSVFINSVIYTLSSIHQSFIRISAWNGFLKRPVCELAIVDEAQKINVEKIFSELNWDYRFVPDVPGMVSARILAMIINEAYYTLQEKISSKEEIDIAMKLGTNYPYGPFEWSKRIGLRNIYELLVELSKTETRYKASKLLEDELKRGF
jgi:3-hydroxybutyryl-CoA dehydrogenase